MTPRFVLPALSTTGGPKDFLLGATLVLRAFSLLWQSRRLLVLALVSSLVTLVTLLGLVMALVLYTDDLVTLIWPRPESWYLSPLWYGAVVATFGVLLVVGANSLPLVLLSPLQDPMSEATEALYREAPLGSSRFSWGDVLRGALASLVHTLLRVTYLVAGHLCLLTLHLLPGVGSLAWTLLATLWTVVWVAGEYLDGPMARHGHRFSELRSTLWARKALALGFGASVHVLLWVPILNLFFMPMAVIGGTLMYLALRQAGDIPGLGHGQEGPPGSRA